MRTERMPGNPIRLGVPRLVATHRRGAEPTGSTRERENQRDAARA